VDEEPKPIRCGLPGCDELIMPVRGPLQLFYGSVDALIYDCPRRDFGGQSHWQRIVALFPLHWRPPKER